MEAIIRQERLDIMKNALDAKWFLGLTGSQEWAIC
jgi:hypothetical protein